MISSVNNGLEAERDALMQLFSNYEFVELMGSAPYNNTAYSGSSAYTTVKMAKECDIYILILSDKYGSEIEGGKSATEVEFDAALKDDPTKIMVFKKNTNLEIEPKQKKFIKKVTDYNSGYFRPSFNYSHELSTLVKNSFYNWLSERTQINCNLNIIDHFLRVAKSILDASIGKIYYRTTQNNVEIEYCYEGKTYDIHFTNEEIVKNFWNSINQLQRSYSAWIGE
jgi:hypothetical protein